MNDPTTPAMKQYYKAKLEYQDSLIFFRMGDFYEAFDEDAKIISKELDITLTARGKTNKGKKMPLAGIPYHSLDLYLPRLIKKGYKVAICEQLENPKNTKGIVKRGVVRVVTPGTAIDQSIITNASNNFLMIIVSNFVNSIETNNNNLILNNRTIIFGISFLDISTGEFLATQLEDKEPYEKIFSEIENMNPSECLLHVNLKQNVVFFNRLKEYNFLISYFNIEEEINKEIIKSKNIIKDQFFLDKNQLNSFHLNDYVYALISCSHALTYILETQLKFLSYIKPIKYYNTSNKMTLDSITLNHLEILKNLKNNDNTLFHILNNTKTPIGSRKLKEWISRPLLKIDDIEKRLNTVEYLINNSILIFDLQDILSQIYDIERIIGRMVYGTSNGRDLITLKKSLFSIINIFNVIKPHITNSFIFSELNNKLIEYNFFTDIISLISKSIEENPPISIRDGHIIKSGYNKEIDDLRYKSSHIFEWINLFQKEERERTGIKSLKVGYNKIFGYYIEVTKSNLSQVPTNYIRKQTMSNCERYFTTELKEQENIILSAEEKIVSLEYDLFIDIVNQICNHYSKIQEISSLIGSLDVLVNFAFISKEYNYIKPIFTDSEDGNIIIKNGRHPVVEISMKNDFIDNDTYINMKNDQILLITGPNMAGKSTYMRQIAMIIIMGQSGCFVPASYAKISIVDKIFTRIGAHDDLTTGKSTFMIEMLELANILNNSTNKSLILLDEIGRGTSTYDGYCIARATLEYLHDKDVYGIRTLFATHYYQLTTLSKTLPKIKNYHVSVKESDNNLLFLRKILPGSTSKSYGIQVAKMAGIPNIVIKKALKLLNEINYENINYKNIGNDNKNNNLIHSNIEINNLLKEIENLDINNMTPINSMLKIFEFKNRILKIKKQNK